MPEELFEAGAEVIVEGAAFVIDAIVEGAAYLVSKDDGHIEKRSLDELEESLEGGVPHLPYTFKTYAHSEKWSVFECEEWDSDKWPEALASKLGYLHYEVCFTTRINPDHSVTITHINGVEVSQEVSDALVKN